MDDEICCLCGLRLANTRDHLFPKCLFIPPRPTNLPTIPACKQCNQELSKDEEAFRVFVAAGMAHEKDTGNRIWRDKIRPDLQGKRKGLKKHISSMVKEIKVVLKPGDNTVLVPIIEMDRGVVNRVLHKIAKGLYYLDTQQIFPKELEILVGTYTEKPGIIGLPLYEAIKRTNKIVLGNGEVIYRRAIIENNPKESLTWIRFYEDQLYLIQTTEKFNT
jgi:hypothetical protein